MDRLSLQITVLAHLQILISQHQIPPAIRMKHQDALLEPGLKSGQIGIVCPMLPVSVDNQCIQPLLLHPPLYLLFALLHGLSGQHHRHIIHMHRRSGHFVIQNLQIHSLLRNQCTGTGDACVISQFCQTDIRLFFRQEKLFLVPLLDRLYDHFPGQ